MGSLAEAFVAEQARNRELLGAYREIGPAGLFGAAMLEDLLQRADAAAMSGDVIQMMQVYGEMKESK